MKRKVETWIGGVALLAALGLLLLLSAQTFQPGMCQPVAKSRRIVAQACEFYKCPRCMEDAGSTCGTYNCEGRGEGDLCLVGDGDPGNPEHLRQWAKGEEGTRYQRCIQVEQSENEGQCEAVEPGEEGLRDCCKDCDECWCEPWWGEGFTCQKRETDTWKYRFSQAPCTGTW